MLKAPKIRVVQSEENKVDPKNICYSNAQYTRKDGRPALSCLQDVAVNCNDHLTIKVQGHYRSKSTSDEYLSSRIQKSGISTRNDTTSKTTKNNAPVRKIPLIKESLNPLQHSQAARPKSTSSSLQRVRPCQCKNSKPLAPDVSKATSKTTYPKSIINSLQPSRYTERYQLAEDSNVRRKSFSTFDKSTIIDQKNSVKRNGSFSQEQIESTVNFKCPKSTKVSIEQRVSSKWDWNTPEIRIYSSTLINCADSKDESDVFKSSPALGMLEQCRNIQYTRQLPDLSNGDKSFEDASSYFSNNLHPIRPNFVKSPIPLNMPLRRSASISEQFEKYSVKTLTTKRKLKSRCEIKDSLLYSIIYNTEYIEDIVHYLYSINSKFIPSGDHVEQLVHKSARSSVVNWVMQINQMLTSSNSDTVFFTAVRIFDWVLIGLKLKKNYYQLAAVASYWISTKYLDNLNVEIPKLFAICNGKFSKSEILSTEIAILKKLGFRLNVVNPLDFLYYYLQTLNIENTELLEYAARFIIDCCSLFENFMITESSFVAAASLVLAYRTVCQSQESFLTFKWHKIEELQAYADSVLVINIRYAILDNCEPIAKYSSPEKRNVVRYFANLV